MADLQPRLATGLAGRYTIERELGRGGMATVWLARDLRHERPVAIKVLHPELAGAIGVDRFVREVQLTTRLQHPNIVPVLDSGVLHGADGLPLPWYAMPYVAGESLRTRLAREQQLPIDDALRITGAVAGALQAAHRQGIVHRDIKPENVLLADGGVYVLDFGIAKALIETGGERLTSTGIAIGTPSYMSPEQASAATVDARSDQYSLATVLYEMLTGEPPFTGTTVQAIMARRFAEPARPLRVVRSTVPAPVEDAVLKALERVPADRFPDLRAFAEALHATAASGAWQSRRPKSRSAWGAVAGAGLLAVAVIGVWLRFGTGLGAHRSPVDPEIVALDQRGLRGLGRRTPAGVIDAVEAFGAAVRRDSTYAPAWDGLAKSYSQAYGRAFQLPGVPRDSILPRALSAVEHALASDSGNSDTWLTQATLSRQIDPTDFGPVLRSLRQAIALDSTNAQALQLYAMTLAETGDLTGALDEWRRSVTAHPSYTEGLAFLALGHYWRRQYDSASTWADSAVAVDPNYVLGHTTVGYIAVEQRDYDRAVGAFEASGRLTTAVDALNALALAAMAEARAGRIEAAHSRLRDAEAKAVAFSPPSLHTVVDMAEAYAALGEAGPATAWLARFQPRGSLHFQFHLRCDPPFDPIKGDRRFKSLLIRPAPPPGQGC